MVDKLHALAEADGRRRPVQTLLAGVSNRRNQALLDGCSGCGFFVITDQCFL
jgi:hypothetical protein